jgi:hypothetical protein
MGSSPKQETTQSQTTNMGPWQPTRATMEGITNQAQGLLGNTGLTGNENAALAGMVGNAQTAGGYGSQIQGLTDNLFAGGGYGQGTPALQQAWGTAQGALNPIASGSLDPMQNPQTAGLVQAIQDQVNNDVGSQFAAAGRSFSGAHAGALGKNLTQALAPTLFNQYNQNVQNAMGASGQLMQGAQGYSQGLDQTAGNQLNAQMQAPGSLANLNTPQGMMLAAEARRRGIPVEALQQLGPGLMVPIAGLGQQGTTTGTGTQQTKGGGTQAAIGTGLGILGTMGQLGIFSDQRLKENIRDIGRTHDGQTIYAFNYIGHPLTHIGLMAQEVAETHPDAVFEAAGYLMVDYAKATEHAHV